MTQTETIKVTLWSLVAVIIALTSLPVLLAAYLVGTFAVVEHRNRKTDTDRNQR